MTELANPGWGALAALLVLIWRMEIMTNATERLDSSVARIAKDVGEVVERIRGNVGVDSAAVLADCDRLDSLSEAIEGLGGDSQEGDTQSGGDTKGGGETESGGETQSGGETSSRTQETPAPANDQPQG